VKSPLEVTGFVFPENPLLKIHPQYLDKII
jgi:hypothetical protein